ncbi:MAG: phosphate ABC transporter permease PstA [Pseudomonadota bacterium]
MSRSSLSDAGRRRRVADSGADLVARGEPFMWVLGGALALGVLMILGFLALIIYNGLATFWPLPVEVVELKEGGRIAGEPVKREIFRPGRERLAGMTPQARLDVEAADGYERRTMYRTGNYDLYNEDFRWVADYQIASVKAPANVFFAERLEWGSFIGAIKEIDLNGQVVRGDELSLDLLGRELAKARQRWNRLRSLERDEIGAINHRLEQARLGLKRVALKNGENSEAYRSAAREHDAAMTTLKRRYERLAAEAAGIKDEDQRFTITMAEVGGRAKTMSLSSITRIYPANDLTLADKMGIYLSRWLEYLTQEPREANTEGGVMPAIFGTVVMTLLLAVAVAPFGVMAALYLREYARQGPMVSLVRICVNNLAGVPSIVYGVFGLGFFAYIVGGSIDQLFYPERLPNPTFGTGGLLWASLTLALLTVPVVIVSTEEALAAVPQSMREGSLACGASKWQTIKYIVLPRALPGIMTGLILAMARGAGEVAPLMLVGVVKLAPELPIDEFFPFVHFERSFMHLGFHIFDVGFQSRNSEAGKPMVFVTTLLLISLVGAMNAAAIYVRNRLRRKYQAGHF